MKTNEQLGLEYAQAQEAVTKRFNEAPDDMNFREYEHYMEEAYEKQAVAGRAYRMVQEPEFSELPNYGDIMSLKEFIENVECGGFIDYDGYGYYVRDNKESNITINPSDVAAGAIRKDFDTIIWYNR